jgi:hypothetical protein
MELSECFIKIVRGCESLPPEVRSHAPEALAVKESCFDASYIEFLDTQIQLSPRGPEWTARLRQRREDLRPYCGVRLLCGVVPVGSSHFSVYITPEQSVVVHWEEYDYPYPKEAI